MTGGTGSNQYRDPVRKWLLIYAASPLVAVIGIIGIIFPYLILLIILLSGIVATARPSK